MTERTPNLNLFKYNVEDDKKLSFDIQKSLSENWDKIDTAFGNIDKQITESLSTIKGIAIGDPILTLSNMLGEDEIWLEGSKVLKTTYPRLTEIYGDTYAPEDARDTNTYLYLPDFRNRTLWGSVDGTFGYLPGAVAGTLKGVEMAGSWSQSDGLFSVSRVGSDSDYWGGNGNVAVCNVTLGDPSDLAANSKTIRPTSIKVRVKTRYK